MKAERMVRLTSLLFCSTTANQGQCQPRLSKGASLGIDSTTAMATAPHTMPSTNAMTTAMRITTTTARAREAGRCSRATAFIVLATAS